MIGRLLRAVLIPSIEYMVALSIVIVCFGVLLVILGLSFPMGATLQDLIKHETFGALSGEDSSFELALPSGAEPNGPLTAMLSDLRRKVQDRPAGAFAWADSHRGSALGRRHAVQTFESSGATISFDAENKLELGENSLIILGDLKQRGRSKPIQASAVMIEGEFRGRFEGTPDRAISLALNVEQGVYDIDSTRQEPTDFKVTVRPDRSSTFALYEGRAALKTDEKVVVIPENHALTLDSDGHASAVVPLPPPPALIGPQEGEAYPFHSLPPRVAFSWERNEQVDSYRFVLARDAEFKQIVHDEVLESPEFVHANLAEGTYFWRVSATRAGGEGRGSLSKSLSIAKDTRPPRLEVEFPEGLGVAEALVLRGRAEPGDRVFVDDIEVPTQASGDFEHGLSLQPGVNLVVVEAIDRAGNVAYLSRVLNGRVE